jgi:hypothetical protein
MSNLARRAAILTDHVARGRNGEPLVPVSSLLAVGTGDCKSSAYYHLETIHNSKVH